VITSERRAAELAREQLHEITPKLLALRLAEKRCLVELPDDPDEAPNVLEEDHKPDALEIADFTLAVWRQALVWNKHLDNLDAAEAEWVSVELASLASDPEGDKLYLRWLKVSDAVTGQRRQLAGRLTNAPLQPNKSAGRLEPES
jgi:hypothetical protein